MRVAAKSIDLLTKTKRKIARGPNLNWCQRNDNALFSFSASLAADLRRIWRAQNHRLKSLSFCEWNRLNWNDHDLDCWLKAGRFATSQREMKYNCWSMWTRGSHKACNYHSIMIHVIFVQLLSDRSICDFYRSPTNSCFDVGWKSQKGAFLAFAIRLYDCLEQKC